MLEARSSASPGGIVTRWGRLFPLPDPRCATPSPPRAARDERGDAKFWKNAVRGVSRFFFRENFDVSILRYLSVKRLENTGIEGMLPISTDLSCHFIAWLHFLPGLGGVGLFYQKEIRENPLQIF